ncbi:MAG TPA: SDR family oxidoreductase [Myxococcales bacterium]|nr:SDR family oxidoreductase [Myxococcales bacterium]
MAERDCILVTGGTGIVGTELVRVLLLQPEAPEVVVLLRGAASAREEKQAWLLDALGLPARPERLIFVSGDVTAPGLGLEAAVGDALAARLTRVIHSAAVTSFRQTPERAFLNNVQSTRNVLELAGRCRRPAGVLHVSSAFVAGGRTGRILEDDLDASTRFLNEYERSKLLSEQVARDAMAHLPVCVLRPSIVVGRREDGWVARFHGIYQVWELFHRGLVGLFPGDPEQPLDVIPADWLAEAIAHLALRRFRPGTTYHLCAGKERSLTVAEIVPYVISVLAEEDPEFARQKYPLPMAVPWDAFATFLETMELTGHRRLRILARQMHSICDTLMTNKVFDTAHLDADLAGAGVPLSRARDWLAPSIRFAARRHWVDPTRRPDGGARA